MGLVIQFSLADLTVQGTKLLLGSNVSVTIGCYVIDLPKEAEATLQCWLEQRNEGGAQTLHLISYNSSSFLPCTVESGRENW